MAHETSFCLHLSVCQCSFHSSPSSSIFHIRIQSTDSQAGNHSSLHGKRKRKNPKLISISPSPSLPLLLLPLDLSSPLLGSHFPLFLCLGKAEKMKWTRGNCIQTTEWMNHSLILHVTWCHDLGQKCQVCTFLSPKIFVGKQRVGVFKHFRTDLRSCVYACESQL